MSRRVPEQGFMPMVDTSRTVAERRAGALKLGDLVSLYVRLK